ncbi:unnamed protein product [Thlaspi arvense]|uniref:Uncharacterized protein n=1 Tax=Thlaspi arvense TaxID=13288 RepID=A0AAU9RS88_THLAR|nr:unnamed protein product [Thlaspi arvense]
MVDIMRRLLECKSPRSMLEDFFNRYGAGEAVAMCLMRVARIVHTDHMITNVVVDKAVEALRTLHLLGSLLCEEGKL